MFVLFVTIISVKSSNDDENLIKKVPAGEWGYRCVFDNSSALCSRVWWLGFPSPWHTLFEHST